MKGLVLYHLVIETIRKRWISHYQSVFVGIFVWHKNHMEATEGLYLTDIFHNKSEVRELTEAWRKNYNEERPHEALDNMTPFEYIGKN